MKKVEAILYPEKAIYFDNTIDDNENEAIKTK
jgi:hypothetical protein